MLGDDNLCNHPCSYLAVVAPCIKIKNHKDAHVANLTDEQIALVDAKELALLRKRNEGLTQ